MRAFEMGGYLPLELHKGTQRFAGLPKECVLAVNTGRTAIAIAIESLGVKKVLAPAYYCPDIIAMLKGLEVELEFYSIGPDLLPRDVKNEPDTAILLVNYFGVMGGRLLEFSKGFDRVVFDNAHAFFAEPVMKAGVVNVYSCRKFIGVCDGAYLVGREIAHPALEEDVSSPRAIHLLKSLELGTASAYAESKQCEAELGERRLAMSLLTRGILGGTDYEWIAQKRRENFAYLHRRLAAVQQLEGLEPDSVPYMYPLLLDRGIHRELVQEHIYVPVLWSQLLEEKYSGTLEQRYAANIVPLPLDQRYGPAELERMIGVIEAALSRSGSIK